MKILLMDMEHDAGIAVGFGLRCMLAGHAVRYWDADQTDMGQGLVEKVQDWKPSMDWAEMIVLTGNCDYPPGLEDYFTKGYPIFGTTAKAAELELDRGKGQQVLKRCGIETLPYKVVSSAAEGIEYLAKQGRPFAMKPWGGESDKAMTAVPRDVEEGIYLLQRWQRDGLFKGQLMLQEMVKGIEVGISGWFGPGGWGRLEESFEHKKLMNDNLGGNTGEMGTVIQYVESSPLFDKFLEPLGDYLQLCHFIGDASVNCMVDAQGRPWVMEFTMRLGWPDFNIRQELHRGDPAIWMADLIYGRDSLEVSLNPAVGVVLVHGDFPYELAPRKDWVGFPIEEDPVLTERHVMWQAVKQGRGPALRGGKVESVSSLVTAGTYVGVATGSGTTVEQAASRAYRVAKTVRWPSNVMYRTDIGKRLEKELPVLHKHGFCKTLKYG